jgi:6-phosphogluconolactonase
MTAVFRHFESMDEIHKAVYELLADQITGTDTSGQYALMIAGGSTPLKIYRKIAQSDLKASENMTLLFSDDRHLNADSPDSNYGNCLPMIRQIGLSDQQVIYVDGSVELEAAAVAYDQAVTKMLENGTQVSLALLGMGADGHTASIFTEEAALKRDCNAFPVHDTGGFNRVSVSTPVLEAAKRIVFLVTGEGKAAILRDFRDKPQSLPSGIAVANHTNVEIWTDLPEDLQV